MALTKKLEWACREYLIDLNWSKAMQRAGYKKSTADNNGKKYFDNPDVQMFIEKHLAVRKERMDRDGDDVIEELEHIAYSNIMDVFDYNVSNGIDSYPVKELALKDLDKLPRSVTATIREIKITPASALSPEKIEIKFHNKFSALETLGRHYQLFDRGSAQGVEFHMNVDLGDGDKAEV